VSRAQGLQVDRAGFDAAMAEQKRAARAAWKGSGEAAVEPVWFDVREAVGATDFLGYATTRAEGVVAASLGCLLIDFTVSLAFQLVQL